jgi:signal transduction histidine kinase
MDQTTVHRADLDHHEYRVRFDSGGQITGDSLHRELGERLAIAVDRQAASSIFDFLPRVGHLDKDLPGRLERRIRKLMASNEEFALHGDFQLENRHFHLHITGRGVRRLNGDLEYTLLFLDDSAHTQLRRLYEYMFRLANHEIKSPLACVIGAVDYAESDLMAGRIDGVKTCMEMIDRNAHAIEDMLTRYLNLSRLESGIIRPNPAQLILSEDVINPLMQEMKSSLRKRGMSVQVSFDGLPEEPEMTGDAEMLTIVMRNLISNGVKYGNANTAIRILISRDDDVFTISVENEGENIPKEQMDKLFRKFMRLDDTRGSKGSGLGLYNSRKTVELWGGRIWVESEDARTRFLFTVPQN